MSRDTALPATGEHVDALQDAVDEHDRLSRRLVGCGFAAQAEQVDLAA